MLPLLRSLHALLHPLQPDRCRARRHAAAEQAIAAVQAELLLAPLR
jgi:hypothetical protein